MIVLVEHTFTRSCANNPYLFKALYSRLFCYSECDQTLCKFRKQYEIPLKIELFESLFSTIEYLSLAISLHSDLITQDSPKHFCSKKELYSHNNVWALFQLCKRTRWIQIPIRSSVPFHWIERWSFQKNWRFCFAYKMLRVFSTWTYLLNYET